MEVDKMKAITKKYNETKQREPPRSPDYRGKIEVAAWVNKDKNGKKYIAVKLSDNFNLFLNEPKSE
jgi:uncharacterized protein (DUF736 family)